MLLDNIDYQKWDKNIKEYEQMRRSNYSYNKPPTVTNKIVKEKQFKFNTVLDKFNAKDDDINYHNTITNKYAAKGRLIKAIESKYSCGYNPITLENANNNKEISINKNNIRKPDFNILTNEIYNKDLDKNKPTKKINLKVFKNYNIISNKYWKDNEVKYKQEFQKEKEKKNKQIKKELIFDPVKCQYYDSEKEKEYKNIINCKKSEYLEKVNNRKQNVIKETIFDPRAINRYKNRTVIEKQLEQKNIYDKETSDLKKYNKYNIKKYNEEKLKGFDSITLNKVNKNKNSEFARAQNKGENAWDMIQRSKLL